MEEVVCKHFLATVGSKSTVENTVLKKSVKLKITNIKPVKTGTQKFVNFSHHKLSASLVSTLLKKSVKLKIANINLVKQAPNSL